MERIVYECSEYIGDPKYVFKSCGNFIVVLEILDDTITNESRSNISDPIYSQYRANKLRVISIINKFDPSDVITKIQNTFYHKNKITYETNKIVEVDDYNMDVDEVCTTGIHYFKTIEPVFYWELIDFNPTYTGKYTFWHHNGIKLQEGEYLDGKRTGKWIFYYYIGIKESEGEYLEDKRTGKWNYWYLDGNKWYECEYLDGKKGNLIFWYPNSNKYEEKYLKIDK